MLKKKGRKLIIKESEEDVFKEKEEIASEADASKEVIIVQALWKQRSRKIREYHLAQPASRALKDKTLSWGAHIKYSSTVRCNTIYYTINHLSSHISSNPLTLTIKLLMFNSNQKNLTNQITHTSKDEKTFFTTN